MKETDLYRDGYKPVYKESMGGVSYPGQGGFPEKSFLTPVLNDKV